MTSDEVKPYKITDNVWWVGAIDWNLRDFHGYATGRGTSYNAYLVMGDKVTLIDTVKKPFFDEMLTRIKGVVDPTGIDYIVSNHSEMDHSGALPEMIDVARPEKVFASSMGVKALKEHLHIDPPFVAVKDGEKLSLGGKNFTFIEARMVHWPDSMFSYLFGDEILFSNDAFGMHLATGKMFTDQCDKEIVDFELKKYFANILMPFSNLILKLLEKVRKLNLPMSIVATDHGPIWRKDIDGVFELYEKWSTKEPSRKAIIIYDTMWGSTELMAKAIADGFSEAGARPILMSLKENHRSDVVTELLDAGAIIVGSPTINNNIFPTVADVLVYLKGLKPKNMIGSVFGSYGWSGESFSQLKGYLAEMKVGLVHEGVNVKYVPDDKAFGSCRALGLSVGEKLCKT